MIPFSSNPYLDLLKRTLTGMIYEDPPISTSWRPLSKYDEQARTGGSDWPLTAHTMIGLKRLDNLQHCVEDTLAKQVPGDFIETGVWRGGASIFMRGILRAHGVSDRSVWVADSFQGLPPPNPDAYPADAGDPLHTYDYLAVSLEEVKSHFERYGLLDDQVRFLEGWFRDTLPVAPIERLAVLRLDGDMYESTMTALTNLYPGLSPGGFVIIDDYGGTWSGCTRAVHDFLSQHARPEGVRSTRYLVHHIWHR